MPSLQFDHMQTFRGGWDTILESDHVRGTEKKKIKGWIPILALCSSILVNILRRVKGT